MQASIANDRFVTRLKSSNSNTCLASTNMVKIMLLQNGHNISPAKQIVYSCFLLMFENKIEKFAGATLSTMLC